MVRETTFLTIDLTSTPMDGKYHQNFNRFYFPTGTIYSCHYIHIVSHHGSIQASHHGSILGSVHCNRITIIQVVLYDEATEEWYVQRDPDEVECEEHNCMHLA